jgi:hypothetical protein
MLGFDDQRRPQIRARLKWDRRAEAKGLTDRGRVAESRRAFHGKEPANSLVNTGAQFMRCFFLRGGHIAGVEMLSGLSDQEAIEAQKLFFSRASGPV